jgi:hypothetical protein
MASGITQNYSIPYPVSTDPVNVTGDVEQLAVRIDNILQETIEDTSAEMWTSGTFSNGINTPTYNDSTGRMSMSLAQDISPSASPTFNVLTISASANFSSIATAVTAPIGDDSRKIATTEFVERALSLGEGLPSQTGNDGKLLGTDGTNASWVEGFPDQTSQSGKFLSTDGSVVSWQNVPAPQNGTLTLNVSGSGLSGSATFTADQSGNSTFTVTSNATSASTPSTLVVRNSSGNFSAGTITANLTGNVTGNASGNLLLTGGTLTGVLNTVSASADGSKSVREITMSTSAPSGGANGDVWIQYS